MPAPAEILSFEHQLQQLALAQLTARALVPAFVALDDSTLPAARVVVEASAFTRASGHMDFARNGQPFYNHYRGQLAFIVTTPRTETGSGQHRVFLGGVRALCSRPAQAFVHPWYRFLKVEEASSTITYVREGERDRSELVYDIELSIPGALMDYAQA